jgi:integrase
MKKNDALKPVLVSNKVAFLSKDIWRLEDLGYKTSEISSSKKSLNFSTLGYHWLVELAKETIWRKRNSVGSSTLIAYLRNLNSLADFSTAVNGSFKKEDLEFNLLESYMASLNVKSYSTQSAYYSGLNEIFTCWKEWGFLPQNRVLLPRDLRPRNRHKSNPRALSASVQDQVLRAVSPPADYFDRLIHILFEVGARGQEVLLLKKDCIYRDTEGWYLTRKNQKFDKEITVPISDKLADIIQDQLASTNYLEEQLGMLNSEGFLFAHLRGGLVKPYTLRNINRRLKKLCSDKHIVDELGVEPKLSTHNFRHTVGTNLINNGVSQFHVQKFLGHESPTMTSVYAQIYDKTMRDAIIDANGKMADIRGKLYSTLEVASEIDDKLNESETNIDAKWLRRNLSTQVLPNGVCALPIRQTCSHANACLTCPSFRTSKDHLKTHIDQKNRTLSLIETAKEKGYVRQVEMNCKVVESIDKIIEVLKVGK